MGNIAAPSSTLADIVPTDLLDLNVESIVPTTASEGITYHWTLGELSANSQATVTISGRIAALVAFTG